MIRLSPPVLHAPQLIQVEAGQSIFDPVCEAGVDALYDCRVGNCGRYAVKVLEGVPDHRDSVLSKAEKERAVLMCICVSRSFRATGT